MKTLLLTLFASAGLAGGAPITVPNGDFSLAGNTGSIAGSLLGGGQTATPLGTGPWNAQTTGLLGLIAPPTAAIASGRAEVSGLTIGALGQANSAQFYQTLSGISYQPGITYLLEVQLESPSALTLNLLGSNGIGIALTAGGNATVVTSSLTAAPQLVSLDPISGSTYTLRLEYTAPGTPPTGDLGIRLFTGIGSGLLSVGALGSMTFDNVSLSAVPEPSVAGLAVAAALILVLFRRKRGSLLAIAAAASLGMAPDGRAALLSLNTEAKLLGVTLLPNSTYQVTAEVTTPDLLALVEALTSNGEPIQILDEAGGVIGTTTAQQLLAGLVGSETINLVDSLGTTIGVLDAQAVIDRLLGTATGPIAVQDVLGQVIGNLNSPAGQDLASLVTRLLGGLLGSGDEVLTLTDLTGGVLATLSLADLVDALTSGGEGLAGTVVFLIETAGEAVVEPIVGVLDTPVLQIGNTIITPAAPGGTNLAPTVQILKRTRLGERARIVGRASDDRGVGKVEMQVNGRNVRVRGTTNWRATAKLREGRNRFVVRAVDVTRVVGPSRRIVMVRKR